MGIELLSANHGAGHAATLAARANRRGRGFCSGVYPITPSTECMEYLSVQSIEKGEVVLVEAEHSAMGVCIGASASGARSFTATAANGLVHMAENVVSAALLRLPVVMYVANRSVGPPWNIWCDHGDAMLLRDAGWMQLYCADNQELFDTVLAAYRLAEDAGVLLPAMVCADGFSLSHTIAQTDLPEQEQVDRFLPVLDLPHRLTLEPRLLGAISPPRPSEVHRRQMHEAMRGVLELYPRVQREFAEIFGRTLPDPVVAHRAEDAEILLLSMGTLGVTVERAVDEARERGLSVGAARVRMFRPFPDGALRRLLAGKRRVGIIDRNIGYGFGGALWGEARGLADSGARVRNYIAGLGGGDVRPEHVHGMLDDLLGDAAGDGPGDGPVFVEAG